MNFSTIMATANSAIEQHLFDDHLVDGLPVRGMFDFEEVSTPTGFQRAPILTVTSIDAANIDKGADFSNDDIDYVVGMRHPADAGFVALELERA
jgi:hypothetical protein